jgi:hypothetical protein
MPAAPFSLLLSAMETKHLHRGEPDDLLVPKHLTDAAVLGEQVTVRVIVLLQHAMPFFCVAVNYDLVANGIDLLAR